MEKNPDNTELSEPVAELDYAFVASFARVNHNNTLTVLDAGFLGVEISKLPKEFTYYIAGRIRFRNGCSGTDLGVEIKNPDGAYVNAVKQIEATADVYGEDRRSHAMFAVGVTSDVSQYGDVDITVRIDGKICRMLKFTVAASA